MPTPMPTNPKGQREGRPKSGLIVTIFSGRRDDSYIGINMFLLCGLCALADALWWRNRRDRRGWLAAVGSLLRLFRLIVSSEGNDRQH